MKQRLIEDLKEVLPIHNWAYWGNTRIAVTQKWDYEAIATELENLGYIHKDDIPKERGEKHE